MVNAYHNYDKYPEVAIDGCDGSSWDGYESIRRELARALSGLKKEKAIVVLDFYPGVREKEVLQEFSSLNPALVIRSEDCTCDKAAMNSMIQANLTEDRVFGFLSAGTLGDFFIKEKMEEARRSAERLERGLVLIYGVGASLISEGDILLYFDLARWEIQLRYRAGMGNWKADNCKDPFLSKYKRGYFVEWRLADRHKKAVFPRISYLVDTNLRDAPKNGHRRCRQKGTEAGCPKTVPCRTVL
jgi:hypothetical protein